MANSPTPPAMILTVVLAVGLAFLICGGRPTAAQNCGCQPGFCCSKFGYCGNTSAYCGEGCKSGPCWGSGGGCGCKPGFCCSKFGYCGKTSAYCGEGCKSGPCWGSGGGGGCGAGGASVASLVTKSFFNGIKSHAGSWCEGKDFYTRSAFLKAVAAYPGFAHDGSEVERKREIAAFFAHVTHETGSLCYINEIDVQKYCDWRSEKQWPCYPTQGYYGRGPLQLSWNYNYGPAGRSLGFDGLRDPDRVAQDPVLSFKSALWYWMQNMHQLLMSQGFGATIRAINGFDECNSGKNTDEMKDRVRFYLEYCDHFGVNPGSDLTC